MAGLKFVANVSDLQAVIEEAVAAEVTGVVFEVGYKVDEHEVLTPTLSFYVADEVTDKLNDDLENEVIASNHARIAAKYTIKDALPCPPGRY